MKYPKKIVGVPNFVRFGMISAHLKVSLRAFDEHSDQLSLGVLQNVLWPKVLVIRRQTNLEGPGCVVSLRVKFSNQQILQANL